MNKDNRTSLFISVHSTIAPSLLTSLLYLSLAAKASKNLVENNIRQRGFLPLEKSPESTARIFPSVALGSAPPTAPLLRRTRPSATLRCSRPLPCVAEALSRRMEALPCIFTVARRWTLLSASSTRLVRSVGGELKGSVALVCSPPPLGSRMEVPPLHLRISGERWAMNRTRLVI